jgi:hypothetical protein
MCITKLLNFRGHFYWFYFSSFDECTGKMEETGSKAPAEPQVCGVNKQEEQMGPIGKSCKCLAEHKALKNTKERLFNMHKIR